MWKWIALAVVVVIVLVLLYGSGWRVRPGVSYTQGINVDSESRGNFRTLGSGVEDPLACQRMCGDADWCNAYTWTQDPAGDHSCVGIKNMQTAKITVGGNYTSGDRVTGWSSKLMHNFGMDSAGAAPKESFGPINAPNTRMELFSTATAPKTGLELFSTATAPKTGLELFNNKGSTMQAPNVSLELFTNQNPGYGTMYANYMRPGTIPTSTQLPGTLYA